MLFTYYILSSNFQKIKIVFILNCVYQYCCARSKKTIFIATHLKLHYLQLKLDGYDQKKTYVSIF